MKQLFILLFVFLVFSVSQARVETPGEALQIIITLYETRDFDTLIQERYAELYKAESQDEVKQLIDRFAKTFEDEDLLQEVIALYTQALSVPPEIQTNPAPQLTETATMAIYNIGETTLKLYLLKTGKWGFHL